MNRVSFDFTDTNWQDRLREAAEQLTGDTSVMGCFMSADGDCNEVFCADSEPSQACGNEDWFVTGSTVDQLIEQIEALI
jgi:hypothetical protein